MCLWNQCASADLQSLWPTLSKGFIYSVNATLAIVVDFTGNVIISCYTERYKTIIKCLPILTTVFIKYFMNTTFPKEIRNLLFKKFILTSYWIHGIKYDNAPDIAFLKPIKSNLHNGWTHLQLPSFLINDLLENSLNVYMANIIHVYWERWWSSKDYYPEQRIIRAHSVVRSIVGNETFKVSSCL